MTITHARRGLDTHGKDQKSTDRQNNSYSHSSRGFAHWLEVAPPTCSVAEVVEAYNEHDSPHDVWDGTNHRLDEWEGHR